MSKVKITCTAPTLREAKELHEKTVALMEPMGLHLARIRAAEADGQRNITSTYVETPR
jgi:hypothetical protein